MWESKGEKGEMLPELWQGELGGLPGVLGNQNL